MYDPAKVIAEAGCNHQGDVETAKRMIEAAAKCGVWAVKFQKRDPRTFEDMTYPHPNPVQSFGNTYGEHRAALEFTPEQHRDLKRVCEDNGVVYASSVWDDDSTAEIVMLEPAYIKIPSARNTHDSMRWLLKGAPCEVHVSLGMVDRDEREEAISLWEGVGLGAVFYHCTSAYPCTPAEATLLEVAHLDRQLLRVGWSSHTEGTVLEVAAYVLGARYIEKHFTLDRALKGTDQALSLEPRQMCELVKNLEDVREALTAKNGVCHREAEQRRKLGHDLRVHSGT